MQKYIIFFLFAFACSSASSAFAGWTQWYDRDFPSGNGDYETLHDLIDENPGSDLCDIPTGIECRETNGNSLSYSSEKVTCATSVGLVCVNQEQPDGECNNYKVRFLCEESSCAALNNLDINELLAPCSINHNMGHYRTVPVVAGATYNWSIDYGTIIQLDDAPWEIKVFTRRPEFTLTVEVTCGGAKYSRSEVFDSYCLYPQPHFEDE